MLGKEYKGWPLLVIGAALYFVWPLTHVMAITKLLMFSGGAYGAILLFRNKDELVIWKSPWFIFAVLLFVWVLFHAAFISENGNEAWKEWTGQWLPAYMSMFVGIGIALTARSATKRMFNVYLMVALALPSTFYLIVTAVKWVKTGSIPIGYWGFSDHKLSLEFYADLLAAGACAKILLLTKKEIKFLKILPWIIPIVLALYVAILSNSLNGVILILGCLTVMISMFVLKRTNNVAKKLAMLSVFALPLMFFLATSSIVTKKIDDVVIESRIASDIDGYQNWINFPAQQLPVREQCYQVKESYYLRVAYVTAGLQAVIEHPWGYGVTRRAFERLVQKKYPAASIANSHNGYIDLTTAVGMPALLLLALMAFSVFRQFKISESEWASPATWMLGLILVHWAIDPISRDHYFETFMFLIGLFATLTMKKHPDHAK